MDSRTGFNDVFGIIVNKLSQVVVGFFGNNIQNKPGLHFFLKTILQKTSNTSPILVNSIISSSFTKEKQIFLNEINDYIESIIEDEDSLPAIPTCYLPRYPSLERIGVENEDTNDFITLIKNKSLNDYNDLFYKIENQIKDINNKKIETSTVITSGLSNLPLSKEFTLKSMILNKLHDKFPETYGEYIDFSETFLNSEFLFRKCMEDIFIRDKCLLLGGKGTGKTAFYLALLQETFFHSLKKRALKEQLDYQVINIISIPKNSKHEKSKFIDFYANFNPSEIKEPENYFRKFWVVYIWNAIRLDDEKTGFNSHSDIEVRELQSNSFTKEYLHDYIVTNEKFFKIERELYEIDDFLTKKNRYLVIIFDQLDKVITPIHWSEAISPLIKYCLYQDFKRIHPKLFLRRDLFNRLGNLTNKASLASQSINLEWSKEELYAFFLKIIFALSNKDFIEYIRLVKPTINNFIVEIEKKLNQVNSYHQLPVESNLLRPLIEIFFGEKVYTQDNTWDTYDWIFNNLQNADKTISLRLFLDIIKYAIEYQQNYPKMNKNDFPILSASSCFVAEVRIKAIKRHVEDLTSEEGNDVLKYIFNDIRENKVPKNLKELTLFQNDFERLMKHIIDQNAELKDKTPAILIDFLKQNGIIFDRYIIGGLKKYTFTYLYKHYLGLSGKRKYDVIRK
jgi:hypothetical protein